MLPDVLTPHQEARQFGKTLRFFTEYISCQKSWSPSILVLVGDDVGGPLPNTLLRMGGVICGNLSRPGVGDDVEKYKTRPESPPYS